MPLGTIQLPRRAPPTTPETKAELVAGVTPLLVETLGKRQEDVVVLIEELDPANWGQGGVTATELRRRRGSEVALVVGRQLRTMEPHRHPTPEAPMRRLIAIEFVTLDGVVQAPGGPEEDPNGGFAHGGWVGPYADPVQAAVIRRQMSLPFDLLLGRRTFEIWAPYWPAHPEIWPEVQRATKYVASNTLTSHAWGPSVFLSGDVAGRVAELKRQPGPDLHLYGSANLLQTLLAHDLVDALWLRMHPITLGRGKRLFDGGSIPAAFRLAESEVTPTGVLLVSYERAGAVPLGHG